MNNSHKTAIARKKPSAPVAYLQKKGLLKGRLLDYGCGKGYDCKYLGCAGYDAYYQPVIPPGKFDTILCTYVLNTVSGLEAKKIMFHCLSLLRNSDSRLYVAVRRDVPKNSKTQRNVVFQNKTEFYTHKGRFAIYEFSKVNPEDSTW